METEWQGWFIASLTVVVPVMVGFLIANWRETKKIAKRSDNPYDDMAIDVVERLAKKIVEVQKEEEKKPE